MRDENSSSEKEQKSVTSENGSEAEIDSKLRAQYEEISQTLLMDGQDENETQQ